MQYYYSQFYSLPTVRKKFRPMPCGSFWSKAPSSRLVCLTSDSYFRRLPQNPIECAKFKLGALKPIFSSPPLTTSISLKSLPINILHPFLLLLILFSSKSFEYCLSLMFTLLLKILVILDLTVEIYVSVYR